MTRLILLCAAARFVAAFDEPMGSFSATFDAVAARTNGDSPDHRNVHMFHSRTEDEQRTMY